MELLPTSLVLALLSLPLIAGWHQYVNLCNPEYPDYFIPIGEAITFIAPHSQLGTKDCACHLKIFGFEGMFLRFDIHYGSFKYTRSGFTTIYTPESTDMSDEEEYYFTTEVRGDGKLSCEKMAWWYGETRKGNNSVTIWGSRREWTHPDSLLYFYKCGSHDRPTTIAPNITATDTASRLQLVFGLHLVGLSMTLLV